ncbi:hypothetical protein [Variovorax sp. M-6]|uniref:hypothetical protein n=1 Tax=Variovorax sp. M-6 TaxID=3233041 RepID=UPI003F95372F
MSMVPSTDEVPPRVEANRHRVLRTPQMARGSLVAYLKIVAPWQGSAEVAQCGREAAVRAGGSPSDFRRQAARRA